MLLTAFTGKTLCFTGNAVFYWQHSPVKRCVLLATLPGQTPFYWQHSLVKRSFTGSTLWSKAVYYWQHSLVKYRFTGSTPWSKLYFTGSTPWSTAGHLLLKDYFPIKGRVSGRAADKHHSEGGPGLTPRSTSMTTQSWGKRVLAINTTSHHNLCP